VLEHNELHVGAKGSAASFGGMVRRRYQTMHTDRQIYYGREAGLDRNSVLVS
jgi:hypothetical protein